MSDFGITDYGFVMPSYDQCFENYAKLARNTFGTEVKTSTDSFLGQFLGIIAYQDITLWEGLEGVFNSQTLNGAEDVYLDDILSKRGIFRNGETAGSGFVYLSTDNKAEWTLSLDQSYVFSGNNGQTYSVTTPTRLLERVRAYSVTRQQLRLKNVLIYSMINTESQLVTLQLDTTTNNALEQLLDWVKLNLSQQDSQICYISNNTLFMGYNQATGSLQPLSTQVTFYADATVGTKVSEIPVQCQVKGYNPLGVSGITAVNKIFSGYVSVGNFSQFNPGSNVESDAEYRARFNDNIDESNAATRPAVYKAVSDLPGVSKVKIYDNPTKDNTPSARAFTFTTVVSGGNPVDIATTIYKKKPINTLTDGEVSYSVPTEDGQAEVIRFSFTKDKKYSLKVVYTTFTNKQFSSTQVSSIKDSFSKLKANIGIGEVLYNIQLQSTVFAALPFGLLSSLEVLTSADGLTWSKDDLVPLYNEKIDLDVDNIVFQG